MGWAGYLKDWKGPAENERPSGYIVIIGDKTISDRFDGDAGIAAQSILLGAVEKGFGGCMIGSIQKQKFREAFKIPTRFEIVMVIALGYPNEEVRLVDKEEDGDIKYWRDDAGVHYVPKRTMDHFGSALDRLIKTLKQKIILQGPERFSGPCFFIFLAHIVASECGLASGFVADVRAFLHSDDQCR